MEKFSLPEFELCAQCVYYKEILEQDYSTILSRLNNILMRCYEPNKNIVEEIFCKYIINKTATEVLHKSSTKFHSADGIIDVIIFKQSQDVDINLLAKVKCYRYGKISDGRKKFLKWQIDKLILNNGFDMLEEYRNYKEENGIKDYAIPNMIMMQL